MRIFVGLLLLGSVASAQMPAARSERYAELRDHSENITSMLATMLKDTENDGVDQLKKKLEIVKIIKKEMGEEVLLRFELMEEVRKMQMGIQYLVHAQKDEDLEARINSLKNIEKAFETSLDQGQLQINRQKAESGKIKSSLSVIRSAIQVFYGDNEGVFPEDLSQLTEKARYITAIPYIMPPGHNKRTNQVKMVSGVRTTEDVFSKVDDSGGWLYVNDRSSSQWGTIIVNCNHKDPGHDTYMYQY